MTSMLTAALAYARWLHWPVVPCHNPVERDGLLVCSCIHKPDLQDPTRCSCGHHRALPGDPCSCGRPDCRVRCSGKPCSNIAKHPKWHPDLVPRGLLSASTDEKWIRECWRRWPDANIASPMGPVSGLFAFDLDRHNPVEDGVENFAALCAELGIDLPDTPLALTGGGGQQLLFRHPGAEYHVKSQTGGDAIPIRWAQRSGIEVKGDGGYIIVSPSLHGSGRRYAWDVSPLDVPPADCPESLLRLVLSRDAKRRTVSAPVGAAATCFLARAFANAGWLGAEIDSGRVMARCPWVDRHSDSRGAGTDSSTVILAPTEQHPLGQFVCKHDAHCAHRGVVAALLALPDDAVASLAADDPAGFSLARSLVSSAPLRRKVLP